MSWIAVGLSGASLVGGLLTNNGGSGSQSAPSLTPEQQRILGLIGKYGETGMLNGQNMEYGGPLGNYDKSAMESAGQNRLMGLMGSAMPQLGGTYATGENALNQLIGGNYYDPMNDGGAFKGFKQSLMRELGESKARTKRDAAVGGNLYSTNTVNKIGDLEAQAMNSLTNKTGELYDTYIGRRINAIPQAINAGLQRGQFEQGNEGLNMNRIGAAMQYGGLDRTLADSRAKDAYNNFLRNRESRIGALGTALGTKATDTVVPTYQQSPWQNMFNTGLNLGTNMMGMNYYKTGSPFGSAPARQVKTAGVNGYMG